MAVHDAAGGDAGGEQGRAPGQELPGQPPDLGDRLGVEGPAAHRHGLAQVVVPAAQQRVPAALIGDQGGPGRGRVARGQDPGHLAQGAGHRGAGPDQLGQAT